MTSEIDIERGHPGLDNIHPVRPLAPFDPADWDAVEQAFTHSHSCALRQHWLETPQAGFMPTTVRTGWTDEALWVFATLSDLDIYNHATHDNAHAWSLGDVFEIFLRACGREPYVEYHITPDNVTLQLHFPTLTALAGLKDSPDRSLEDFMVPSRPFDSWTRVRTERNLWHVLARIPAKNISAKATLDAGEKWRFNFCRYDYTRATDSKMLSSTSWHEQVGFHRHPEWGLLVFQA